MSRSRQKCLFSWSRSALAVAGSLAALSLSKGQTAEAATRTWAAAVNREFDDSIAWVGGVIPATNGTDAVRFDVAGTYEVQFSNNTTATYGGHPSVQSVQVLTGAPRFITSTIPRKALNVNGSGGTHNVDISLGGTLHLGQQSNPFRAIDLNVNNNVRVFSGTMNVWDGSRAHMIGVMAVAHAGVSTATLRVSGSGSTVIAEDAAPSIFGRLGGVANVTFENGAVGQFTSPLPVAFGGLDLADSSTAGTRANVSVLSGAALNVGRLRLATAGGATTAATLTISGTNSNVTQTGASTLTVGHTINGSATINLNSGGRLTSGTGLIHVQRTGTINIGSGGTFVANGNVNIQGGTVTRASGGTFSLASGRNLTVQNAGSFSSVAGIGLQAGSTYSITSGGTMDIGGALNIAASGAAGTGTMVVNGSAAAVSIGSGSTWGSGGRSAAVTVMNGGTVQVNGFLRLPDGNLPGTSATINIHSGGTMTVDGSVLMTPTTPSPPTVTASISVSGAGSRFTQTGGNPFTIGSGTEGSQGAAVVSVADLGVISTGTGDTTIRRSGQLDITGNSTFNANGNVVIDGGMFNRNAGGAFSLASGRNVTVANGGSFFSADSYTLNDGSTFNVQTGGTVTFRSILGIASTGDGTLLVDGPGTRVSIGEGVIGSFSWGVDNNTATVRISNEAALHVNVGIMLANSFIPGSGPTGIVEVFSGAQVTVNDFLRLAHLGGAATSAAITVDGAGSTFTQNGDSNFTIGHDASGLAVVNVRNGGAFTTSTGSIDVRTTGQINLDSGGVFHARGPVNMVGGQFNFLGGTLHVGQFNGDLLNQGGTLAPGASAGVTNIDGNYTQLENAALQIEIGGTTPGTQHDRLNVTEGVALSGQIALSLIDGFVPVLYDDAVQIISGGTVTGRFDTVAGAQPAAGLGLAVVYAGDGVSVVPAIPGDATLDGAVTIADLSVLAGNWQQSGRTWQEADFTGDGIVNIADLSILAGNWQMGAFGGSSMSFAEALAMFDPFDKLRAGIFDDVVVPEPGTVTMTLLLGAGLIRRTRRRGPGAAQALSDLA